MQIRGIVLYSAKGAIRKLQFRLGALNIVTGDSKTGKTALIAIIDYCLGGSELKTPRPSKYFDAIAWYAVLLRFGNREVFIARRKPKEGLLSSTAVYYKMAANIGDVPMSELEPNINTDALLELLAELLGMRPYVHEAQAPRTSKPLPATFKHARLFCFQAQYDIANPKHLFHGTEEQYVRQAIRDLLPYFLGATDENTLAMRLELRHVRDKLRNVRARLEVVKAQNEMLRDNAIALLTEAADVGMIDSDSFNASSLASILQVLEGVAKWTSTAAVPASRSADGLSVLQQEHGQLVSQQRQLIEQREQFLLFQADIADANSEGTEQMSRLRAIELLDSTQGSVTECPICRSELQTPVPSVSEMNDTLQSLSRIMQGVLYTSTQVEKELEGVEHTLHELEELIRRNMDQQRALIQSRRTMAQIRDVVERKSRMAGRASLFLEGLPKVDAESSMRAREEKLAEEAQNLEQALSAGRLRELTDSISNIISSRMSALSKGLPFEFADSLLRLDFNKLTVIVDEDSPATLAQMGSGENHLFCHVLAHLALHEWFVKRKRPVPRFLFLDQPSQVYFENYPASGRGGSILKDNDRASLESLYELISAVVTELDGELQVIVTEHAELQAHCFSDNVVERWRGGKKLVPSKWLTEDDDATGQSPSTDLQ